MAARKNQKSFRKTLEEKNCKVSTNSLNIPSEGERDLDSDIDTKRQIRYGTRCQAAWGIFSEYCDNSTVHGIKYVGEQKRPILERLFWIGVFVLSIYTCTVLTMNIWKKWTNNPVIESFAEKSTPVWEIPFPAVTICKERKYDADTFNYTRALKRLNNITANETKYLKAISQICHRHELEHYMDGIEENFANGSHIIGIIDHLLNHSNPCFRMKWRNNKTNCNRFERIVTEGGLCYTFNDLQHNDIYRAKPLENDYIYEDKNGDGNVFQDYPQTNSTDGDEDDDEYKETYISNEILQWNMESGYNFDANKDAFPFRVLRNIVDVLSFLCRTTNTRVCGPSKLKCMWEAEDFLANKEFMKKNAEESQNVASGCNCLPGCTSISYNAEISQGSIDWLGKRFEIRRRRKRSKKLFEWSELSIFFKEAQFLTSKRSELYGRTEFLANCGGLFGLFMGISSLSVVELVYFCTVRLLTNLKMRRRKRLELERVRLEEGLN